MKILKTCGYGAGWSTWCSDEKVAEFILTYQPIIDHLENLEAAGLENDLDEDHPLLRQLEQDVKTRFGVDYVCLLGAKNLEVVEAPSYISLLNLKEYDGNESQY